MVTIVSLRLGETVDVISAYKLAHKLITKFEATFGVSLLYFLSKNSQGSFQGWRCAPGKVETLELTNKTIETLWTFK